MGGTALCWERERKWQVVVLQALPCYVSFPHIAEVEQTYSGKENDNMLVIYCYLVQPNNY